MTLHPPREPFASGMLPVGDGNTLYWEESGRPDGLPAVVLHGGPGQGSHPNMRRMWDPACWRVVLYDQRGCGKSTPHASDPATDMSVNTTAHLVADLERLREARGIDRWVVAGGSWGTALALAYAQRHPSRVRALVLSSVTTMRRAEIAWLYHGARIFFPEAWACFRDAVPRVGDESLPSAYARAMDELDPVVRERVARAWCAWEDAVLSLEPNPSAVYGDRPVPELLAFVRICARYAANGAWLAEDELLRSASKLAGIPGFLVHGRRDLSAPIGFVDDLARAWPDAHFIPLDDAGHLATPSKRAALLRVVTTLSTWGG